MTPDLRLFETSFSFMYNNNPPLNDLLSNFMPNDGSIKFGLVLHFI